MSRFSKMFVYIFCKHSAGSFSRDLTNILATGDQIFQFLMKDAQLCIDESNKEILPGDCNLWYLGLSDNWGQIRYSQKSWRWSSGKSSFDIVEDFVSNLYGDNLITKQQFEQLTDKINEGRFIGNTTDIKNYLLRRKEGRPFIPLSRVIENNMKMIRRKNQSSAVV